MKNQKIIKEYKEFLRKKLFYACINYLINYKGKLLPHQYNYLYSSLCTSMLFELARYDTHNIVKYDDLITFLRLPNGFDTASPPPCPKCPYKITNHNELNFEDYEEKSNLPEH